MRELFARPLGGLISRSGRSAAAAAAAAAAASAGAAGTATMVAESAPAAAPSGYVPAPLPHIAIPAPYSSARLNGSESSTPVLTWEEAARLQQQAAQQQAAHAMRPASAQTSLTDKENEWLRG